MERDPSSKVKMSAKLGVDVKTLRRWEKKPAFRKQWEERVNDIQGSPERTQSVLDMLYSKAMEGDTKSAQLYLQATNRMAPPTIEVKSDRKAAEMSDAELDELIAAMAAREKESRHLKAI
jgi:DNA-binding transcriptional regulator YiaG